jgi:hypothetical protein
VYWGIGPIQDENNNARLNQYVNNSIQNSNTLTENTTYVQNLMNNATTTELKFIGNFNVENKILLGGNYINLDFTFGGSVNKFIANYEFYFREGSNEYNFSGNNIEGTINSTGFDYYGGSGEDIIKGKFNGSTIDSVSGTITDNNDYNVSFSANKQ